MGTSVTQAQFMTSIRYLLAVAGAWLVGKGYLSNEALANIIPVALVVGPYLWGLYANWAKEQQAKIRETAAVRAGAAMAADPAILTPPAEAISPKEAQGIIAAYAPEPAK